MNCDQLRDRAAVLRDLPLESVLLLRGAARDCHDKSKWHTEQGPVSITGSKFMNWHRGQGGGGAIDLVMHLADTNFRTALRWLEQNLGHAAAQATTRVCQRNSFGPNRDRRLRLPVPDDRRTDVVRGYLTGRRHLPDRLLDPLFESGGIYADSRANAVFLMVAGKPNRPVGAEIRGTGPRIWRGMAPGSRKDRGYFWIGPKGADQIVLCESAIDAMSCYQIFPRRICISTAGVRPNPRWLAGLIAHGYRVHCGFDADQAGDAAANKMIARHPAVARLRPPAHDWNDALASRA